MPIFILVDFTDDAVKLVARKLLRASNLGGTDSEYLHGWPLKIREYIKILRTSVETFSKLDSQ